MSEAPITASLSYSETALPPGEEPGLKAAAAYTNPTAKPFRRTDFNIQLTHSNSTPIAVVKVDTETFPTHESFVSY